MRVNPYKQQSKRPWRTPSASSSTTLHSPRSPASFQNQLLKIDSMKQLQQDRKIDNKSKYRNYPTKNQLFDIKQSNKKIQFNDPLNHKFNYHFVPKQQITIKKNQIQSYNSYYSKNPALADPKVTNYSIKTSNKKIALQKNQFETNNVDQIQKKLQDQLQLYIEQNNQLKLQIKLLAQKCIKLQENNQILENSILLCKVQIQTHKTMHNQKNLRENQLHQEIETLKQILQTATCNLQLNKTKQQTNGFVCQKQKHFSINSMDMTQKQKSKQQTIRHLQQQRQCLSCKSQQKTITSMNTSIQNRMLQLSKKNTLVLSLSSQVQKLKQQRAVLQKPKQMLKKLFTAIQNANQQAMKLKAIELNKKFKALLNKNQ